MLYQPNFIFSLLEKKRRGVIVVMTIYFSESAIKELQFGKVMHLAFSYGKLYYYCEKKSRFLCQDA